MIFFLVAALLVSDPPCEVTVTIKCPQCKCVSKPTLRAYRYLAMCMTGPSMEVNRVTYFPCDYILDCLDLDSDGDGDVDLRDVSVWLNRR